MRYRVLMLLPASFCRACLLYTSRYDLTLPLSRYYAANKDKLPNPFKVIQTDRVFRAEQIGRAHV